MKKLSIRKRETSYQVGPAGVGPTVSITAGSRREALKIAKQRYITPELRAEIRTVRTRFERKGGGGPV